MIGSSRSRRPQRMKRGLEPHDAAAPRANHGTRRSNVLERRNERRVTPVAAKRIPTAVRGRRDSPSTTAARIDPMRGVEPRTAPVVAAPTCCWLRLKNVHPRKKWTIPAPAKNKKARGDPTWRDDRSRVNREKSAIDADPTS